MKDQMNGACRDDEMKQALRTLVHQLGDLVLNI
jgi:hypothetical protein